METINDVGDQWIQKFLNKIETNRSIPPEVIVEKDVLKICSEFTREHPCRSVISIKLLCNFIEITLRHGCSPVNLLQIFRTPFRKNISVWLLLFFSFDWIWKVSKLLNILYFWQFYFYFSSGICFDNLFLYLFKFCWENDSNRIFNLLILNFFKRDLI